jgi:EF hand
VEWDEWVRTAFEVFDHDGSGRLSVEDLNKLLCGDVCVVRRTYLLVCLQQWQCVTQCMDNAAGIIYGDQSHALLYAAGAVQALLLLPMQVSDTVEAALREADIDHDGSIGLAGEQRLKTLLTSRRLKLCPFFAFCLVPSTLDCCTLSCRF